MLHSGSLSWSIFFDIASCSAVWYLQVCRFYKNQCCLSWIRLHMLNIKVQSHITWCFFFAKLGSVSIFVLKLISINPKRGPDWKKWRTFTTCHFGIGNFTTDFVPLNYIVFVIPAGKERAKTDLGALQKKLFLGCLCEVKIPKKMDFNSCNYFIF